MSIHGIDKTVQPELDIKKDLNLFDALPSGFEFYHVGKVVSTTPSAAPAKTRLAVSYTLYGELRGMVVVLFENASDEGLFAEVGNIISARFCSNIVNSYKALDLDIMMTPPKPLNLQQMKRLEKNYQTILSKNYLLQKNEEQDAPFEVQLIVSHVPHQLQHLIGNEDIRGDFTTMANC